MKKIILSLVMISFSLTAGATAQDDPEFGRIFDAYNVAANKGDVNTMLSLSTTERQKEISGQIKGKKDRANFLLISRAQVPESYQIQHVSRGQSGQSATLYLVGQFSALPEMQRPRLRMEELISFKRENGLWKIDKALPLGDPDKIQRPQDLTYDPQDANLNATGEIAGRILKTEFQPGYTLVLLRVMDEEHAVFLPAKEALEKAGVPLKSLDPWNLYQFSGHPHKSETLKFFATSGKSIEE
jgi:hypothetical protein